MKAFHGSEETKATFLARVAAHREADEIVQGVYWERGKGCAVGCTIHGSNHSDYETELGIPRVLAHLEDRLFELMSSEDAKGWPERFLSSIPVGADLSLVWPKFAIWLLIDETDGVVRFAKNERTKRVITDVAALYERVVNGEAVPASEFMKARAAAYAYAYAYAAAAAAAAYAYAYAADADAAAAYAYAAAADAGRSARRAYALRASRKLEELLVAAR